MDDSLFDRPLGYEEVRMSDIIRWVAAQQQAERGGLYAQSAAPQIAFAS